MLHGGCGSTYDVTVIDLTCRRGLEARGLDPFAALRIPEILLATGLYQGVDTTRADIPLSPWSDGESYWFYKHCG